MRNLKKILALVLALVMSLSLMATAGAADNSAAANSETISAEYQTAKDVLSALGIFKGYEDGSFKPKQSITRAEVATILYRMVTGDVASARSDIYGDMQQSTFTDLAGANWARGYINYCANAKLIVGVGGNKFQPSANITGYATLAMVLRALGYDKNGEFQGTGWEIRTASTARELGILNNVNAAEDLGKPATREMVAEILFRAMLCDMVEYNALTQDYKSIGVTLGYKVFTLEKVEGVVVANEYADIRRDADGKSGGYSTISALAGSTVLRSADKDRIVKTASTLEDLGETRIAYTTEKTNTVRDTYDDLRKIPLENPDKDDVFETGDKLSSLSGKVVGNEALHFVNFGEDFSNVTTTIKVTYQARRIATRISALTAAAAETQFKNTYHLAAAANLTVTPSYLGSGVYDITYIPTIGDIAAVGVLKDGHTYTVENIRENGVDVPYYRVQIEPNAEFTSLDKSMVEAIFARADRLPEAPAGEALVVTGEVFRGTQSRYDYSDWQNYTNFRADCLKESVEDTKVTGNSNGWWLKIIDNDKDGVTDWVFQTRYTMASVSAVKDGVPTLETENPWGGCSENDLMNKMSNASATTDESGDLAVNDVVYYAVIDGIARAYKADVVEGRVNSVNRTDLTITTGDGTTYTESANHEHSARVDIDSGVVNMSGTTNYKLYLDKYGYLGAFSQNISGKFVLLTNGWFQNMKNGVEYAVTAWDSETQALKQYDITSGGNLFVGTYTGNANGWNNIREFPNVNCDDATHLTAAQAATIATPGEDDLHTIVAYMETDGDTATLVPVDTIYDTERINGQAKRMIDMGKIIPDSTARDGVRQDTITTAGQPYISRQPATDRVRAMSTTTYYYVYRSWNANQGINNEGASVYVKQFTGYEAGSSYLNAADRALYVEDVYVVGTRANDVFGEYYAADVVVVELNDDFFHSHLDVEEVFIYDFPVVGTWSTIEEVRAIRADGTNDEHLKIDLTGVRTYTDVTNTQNGNSIVRYQPGLYYLHRTARTDSEGIWNVSPMSHEQIRASGHYDAGTVVASDFVLPANYAEMRDWVCLTAGSAADVHNTDAGRAAAAITTYTNPTRKNVEGSDYYNLSYTKDTHVGTASATTAGDCLRQPFGVGVTSDYNWNQVLVRYDGNRNSATFGDIIYAISFAHQNGDGTENFAQSVWRSSLFDQGRQAGNRTLVFSVRDLPFVLSITPEDAKMTDVIDSITVDGAAMTKDEVDDCFRLTGLVEKGSYDVVITWAEGITGTVDELVGEPVGAKFNTYGTIKLVDADAGKYTLTLNNSDAFTIAGKTALAGQINILIDVTTDEVVDDPLKEAKDAAEADAAEFLDAATAELSEEELEAAQEALDAALATFNEALAAAEDQDAIDAALKDYEDAVNAALGKEPEVTDVTVTVTWTAMGDDLEMPEDVTATPVETEDGYTLTLDLTIPEELTNAVTEGDEIVIASVVYGEIEAVEGEDGWVITSAEAFPEAIDVTADVTFKGVENPDDPENPDNPDNPGNTGSSDWEIVESAKLQTLADEEVKTVKVRGTITVAAGREPAKRPTGTTGVWMLTPKSLALDWDSLDQKDETTWTIMATVPAEDITNDAGELDAKMIKVSFYTVEAEEPTPADKDAAKAELKKYADDLKAGLDATANKTAIENIDKALTTANDLVDSAEAEKLAEVVTNSKSLLENAAIGAYQGNANKALTAKANNLINAASGDFANAVKDAVKAALTKATKAVNDAETAAAVKTAQTNGEKAIDEAGKIGSFMQGAKVSLDAKYAALQKDSSLDGEQKAKIKTAYDEALAAVSNSVDKAGIEKAEKDFDDAVEKIKNPASAVISGKKITVRYHLDKGVTALTADALVALLNTTGKTFTIANVDEYEPFAGNSTSYKAINEGTVYDLDIRQYFNVTIDGKAAGTVGTDGNLSGVKAGTHYTTDKTHNTVATATTANGSGVLALGATAQDVDLFTVVQVTKGANYSQDVKVLETTSTPADGNQVAVATTEYVRKGATLFLSGKNITNAWWTLKATGTELNKTSNETMEAADVFKATAGTEDITITLTEGKKLIINNQDMGVFADAALANLAVSSLFQTPATGKYVAVIPDVVDDAGTVTAPGSAWTNTPVEVSKTTITGLTASLANAKGEIRLVPASKVSVSGLSLGTNVDFVASYADKDDGNIKEINANAKITYWFADKATLKLVNKNLTATDRISSSFVAAGTAAGIKPEVTTIDRSTETVSGVERVIWKIDISKLGEYTLGSSAVDTTPVSLGTLETKEGDVNLGINGSHTVTYTYGSITEPVASVKGVKKDTVVTAIIEAKPASTKYFAKNTSVTLTGYTGTLTPVIADDGSKLTVTVTFTVTAPAVKQIGITINSTFKGTAADNGGDNVDVTVNSDGIALDGSDKFDAGTKLTIAPATNYVITAASIGSTVLEVKNGKVEYTIDSKAENNFTIDVTTEKTYTLNITCTGATPATVAVVGVKSGRNIVFTVQANQITGYVLDDVTAEGQTAVKADDGKSWSFTIAEGSLTHGTAAAATAKKVVSSLALTMTAPTAGNALPSSIADSTNSVTITAITWSEKGAAPGAQAPTTAGAGKTYVVSFTIEAKQNFALDEEVSCTVGGVDATVENTTVTCEFAVPAK